MMQNIACRYKKIDRKTGTILETQSWTTDLRTKEQYVYAGTYTGLTQGGYFATEVQRLEPITGLYLGSIPLMDSKYGSTNLCKPIIIETPTQIAVVIDYHTKYIEEYVLEGVRIENLYPPGWINNSTPLYIKSLKDVA